MSQETKIGGATVIEWVVLVAASCLILSMALSMSASEKDTIEVVRNATDESVVEVINCDVFNVYVIDIDGVPYVVVYNYRGLSITPHLVEVNDE